MWVQNSRRQDLIGKTAEQLNKGGYVLCSKQGKYCQNIDTVVYASKVMGCLLSLTDCDDSLLDCPSGVCHLHTRVAKLFLTVRLHFTLKDSSLSFVQRNQKRNRKVMKLTHI